MLHEQPNICVWRHTCHLKGLQCSVVYIYSESLDFTKGTVVLLHTIVDRPNSALLVCDIFSFNCSDINIDQSMRMSNWHYDPTSMQKKVGYPKWEWFSFFN
jgi:hypothetical protein